MVLLYGAAIVVDINGDGIVIVDTESTQSSLFQELLSYVKVKFRGNILMFPFLSVYLMSVTLPMKFKVMFSHSIFSSEMIPMSFICGMCFE